MTLPTFIVFGTRKAGTTSLYHYLDQHPEVFVSALKGTRYFIYDPDNPEAGKRLPVKTLEEYQGYFEPSNKTGAKAIGEVSPSYLSNAQAAARMKATVPGVRLVASLRNPVDRAYSQFQMDMRLRQPNERVELTLDNASDWLVAGMYARHMKRYYAQFSADQIKVFVFENWIADPGVMLKALYEYIGVDTEFCPDMGGVYNKGGIPKSRMLSSLLRHRQFYTTLKPYVPKVLRSGLNKVRNRNMAKAEALSSELREFFQQHYESDIGELEDLIGQDLSIWRKSPN